RCEGRLELVRLELSAIRANPLGGEEKGSACGAADRKVEAGIAKGPGEGKVSPYRYSVSCIEIRSATR
ncbi:MAG TPA: hypothetical protein VIG08_16865, partial [Gemmatimonadales bacterium]